MRTVLLNGHPVSRSWNGRETLSEIVAALATDLNQSECITRVHADGEDVTGRADRQDEIARAFQSINVTTGKRSALALDVLDSIAEFRSSLVAELSRAAEYYRIGNEELSNNIFVRCLDGLQVLLRTTQSAANLLDVNQIDGKKVESSMNDSAGKINRLLDEMIDAQTQRDPILLADLIEYELVPILEEWEKMIGTLKMVGVEA